VWQGEQEHTGGFRRAAGARRKIDPEWLSYTIGDIYDWALQAGKWAVVIETICRELAFGSAVPGIVQLRPDVAAINAQFGIDADWLAKGGDYARASRLSSGR
jgi:hypothetical protein